MRKLASIQEVREIKPIPGADLIEMAVIKGWQVVIKKGEFEIGNKGVYFEIDSFLPIQEQYEFLRKSSYKIMGEEEGFRLRTVKLRGQISQGLLLPLNSLGLSADLETGTDVTELLGVKKYEPPIPAQLAGDIKSGFPSFIPKTDEERVQNLDPELWIGKENLTGREKLDGTSATFYFNSGGYGVCSRNWELKPQEGNTYWIVSKDNNLETKLQQTNRNLAIQGEIVGPGIQGNVYKFNKPELFVFTIFDIDNYRRLNEEEMNEVCEELGLRQVPIVYDNISLPNSLEELLAMAEGKSLLNPKVNREGLVFRTEDQSLSFKAISNNFLLKQKD